MNKALHGIHFTDAELEEIKRVNQLSQPTHIQALSVAEADPNQARELLEALFTDICNKISITVIGAEKIPQEANFIIAANHALNSAAYLNNGYCLGLHEAVLYNWLTKHTKRRIHLCSRETSFYPELMACLERVVIGVNPDLEEINRQSDEKLSQGGIVVNFPEGGYYGNVEDNQDHYIGPFKRGLYHMGARQNKLVVPLSLTGLNRAGSTSCVLRFSQPLNPQLYYGGQNLTRDRMFIDDVRKRIFCQEFGFKPTAKKKPRPADYPSAGFGQASRP